MEPGVDGVPQELGELRVRLGSTVLRRDLLTRAVNVPLKMHQCIEHRLWSGWAAGDVHINRDNLIYSRHRGVIVVEPPRRGARPERDHPLRLRHLFVDPQENGRELVGYRADDEEEVGLARGKAR